MCVHYIYVCVYIYIYMYIYIYITNNGTKVPMTNVDLMDIQIKSLGLQDNFGSRDTFNHSYYFSPIFLKQYPICFCHSLLCKPSMWPDVSLCFHLFSSFVSTFSFLFCSDHSDREQPAFNSWHL